MLFFDNFLFFLGPETISPKLCGAQVALLQNSAGHRLRGPKLRGAQVEGSKTQPLPRGFLDPSTCAPQSFGAMQPVPRGIWRHSFRDQHNH